MGYRSEKFRKIKLIDNTDTNDGSFDTFANGFSQFRKLVNPNEGIDQSNRDTVHFFDFGLISAGEFHFVNEDNVFLRNGFLQKPGLIVKRQMLTKSQGGLIMTDEEFFKVVDSNMPDVNDNDLVVVSAGTSYRFNYNNEMMNFVYPDKVFLVGDSKTGQFKAGPNYLLIEPIKPAFLTGNDVRENVGMCNGEKLYFESASFDVQLKNKHFRIVHKDSIKVVSS